MKKKGRALTAVLLGLTMVMSLAGCGQKKESTADTAAAGSEAAKTEVREKRARLRRWRQLP